MDRVVKQAWVDTKMKTQQGWSLESDLCRERAGNEQITYNSLHAFQPRASERPMGHLIYIDYTVARAHPTCPLSLLHYPCEF